MLTLHAHPVRGPRAPIRQLIQRPAVYVSSTLTLREVAETLEADSLGAVLVRVRGKLAGLLSERDLSRALADGADPDTETALDVMTDDLAIVTGDTPIAEVADLMLRMEIRHVPVVDGTVAVGVVSIRDLLAVLVESQAIEA